MTHQSLSEKYATPELRKKYEGVVTDSGHSFEDVIRSGEENPDSNIGAYAPDASAYRVFKEFFDAIILDYHSYGPDETHPSDLDLDHLDISEPLPGDVSIRMRMARAPKGYPLPAGMNKEQRLEIEDKAEEAFKTLEGDLKGTYYSLVDQTPEWIEDKIAKHQLFKQSDKYLDSAGITEHWPAGQGIFIADNEETMVWVGEEDAFRIIAMKRTGDLRAVFERLVLIAGALEKEIPFDIDSHLGAIASCPTNLGTGMRASIHLSLPHLTKSGELEGMCKDLKLAVRGIHGEHSESGDKGEQDLSPTQRLGVTEVQVVQSLYDGVKTLLAREAELAESAESAAA